MRKGISAIVAIILLLLMTVAAAGIAYTWLTAMQSGTQQTVSSGISEIEEKTGTKIEIISVTKTGNFFNVALKNSGQSIFDITTTNTQVIIDGTKVTFSQDCNALEAGKTCTITTSDGPQFPSSGVTRDVKVILSNGLTLSYKCYGKYVGSQLVC